MKIGQIQIFFKNWREMHYIKNSDHLWMELMVICSFLFLHILCNESKCICFFKDTCIYNQIDNLLKRETIKYYFLSAFRHLHPEGLPSDYTISFLFRILPDTPEEPFALWEILNKNSDPLVGVILDSKYISVCNICTYMYEWCMRHVILLVLCVL